MESDKIAKRLLHDCDLGYLHCDLYTVALHGTALLQCTYFIAACIAVRLCHMLCNSRSYLVPLRHEHFSSQVSETRGAQLMRPCQDGSSAYVTKISQANEQVLLTSRFLA